MQGIDGTILEFRPLNDNDLSLIEIWLNKEHVKRWYEVPRLGITVDDWVSELKEYRGQFQWITYLIVLRHDRPIGLCLYYKCEDSEDEDFGTLPVTGSYGIDYLIGEASQLGKGLGKELVAMLVDRIFSLPDALRVTADIDVENKASERTLISCGFTRLDAGSGRYVLDKKAVEARRETGLPSQGQDWLRQSRSAGMIR